jgi:homoserine dehydrogenase
MRGQRGGDAGDRMLRRHDPRLRTYATQDAGRGEERGVEPVRVALLGCGVVGTEVARNLTTHASELTQRVGAPLELAGIAVRRPGRRRGLEIDPDLFTTDAASLVKDADVVVEVIGGIEPARSLLLEAMAGGASVVTANKALLAEDGPTLYEAADAAGVDLYFEAAVAGAIPLLRPLRESLAGDRVRRVLGIVNGTTNYVLDKMHTTGMGFAEAVEQAQALGYAEADPTADVEGFDAAAKAAILASLAFHSRVRAADVHREGITAVTAADVASAKAMNAVVKLLAICERGTRPDGGDTVSVRVHPAMIPATHPLAGVGDAYNAVFVEAEAAGELMFYGRGAGGQPTASAVLGDLVGVARNRVGGGRGPGESSYADLPVRPMGEVPTRYHVSLDVEDRPGVLAQVAQVFAEHAVSIETVRQQVRRREDGPADRAALVIVTHTAPDAALAATVEALARLDTVASVDSVMRVEGTGEEGN